MTRKKLARKKTARRKAGGKKKARNQASRKKSARRKSVRTKAPRKRTTRRKATRKKSSRRAAATKKTARKKVGRKKPARKKSASRKSAPKRTTRTKSVGGAEPVKIGIGLRPPADLSQRSVASAAKTTLTAPAIAVAGSSDIGVVTHYYPHVDAAVVLVGPGDLHTGDTVHFHGHTTDFYQTLDRLEFNHQPIDVARPGQEVGVHVSHRVREGDVVKLVA
jgi:hypothetical protein